MSYLYVILMSTCVTEQIWKDYSTLPNGLDDWHILVY